MPKSFYAIALAFCVVLAACGGGGGSGGGAVGAIPAPVAVPAQPNASGYPGDPSSCSIADQRGWLNDYMMDKYFWNANLGMPNAAATSTDSTSDLFCFYPPTATALHKMKRSLRNSLRKAHGQDLAIRWHLPTLPKPNCRYGLLSLQGLLPLPG